MAVKERVFFVKNEEGVFVFPFRPSQDDFEKSMLSFYQKLKANASYTTPMKPQQFVDAYQGRRKAVYQRAIDLNALWGFHPKYANIRSFTKCEKYNFSKPKTPVPRVIQPRNERYIVETGRYVKPIEKKIYKIVDDIFGDKTVYKGLNAEQRGQAIFTTWNRYRKPVAIGLDASRFDQHVSNAALCWEHSVYQLFYPGDKYFRGLMGLQRNNKCVGYTKDGWLKYSVKHNRMSGDSNTSLGNVLLMCGMVYMLKERTNVQFSLINDGDDCVIVCEHRDLKTVQEAIPEHFAALGFKMVVEDPVHVLEHVEFCQSHPVYDGEKYIMVRDPRISTSKDAVALKPLDKPLIKRRWLKAVGLGGLSLTRGIPVLQHYYECFDRNAGDVKPLEDPTLEGGFFRLSKGMNRTKCEVSPLARLSFWDAFNIPPSAQLALEEHYSRLELTDGELKRRFALLPINSKN